MPLPEVVAAWNRPASGCVRPGMTDDELDRITERHFEGLPPRSGKESEVYAGLDFVVWELQMAKKW